MPLRDLRYFLAVAEELHFTRAAKRRSGHEQALRKQIRLLEQDLRVPLLEAPDLAQSQQPRHQGQSRDGQMDQVVPDEPIRKVFEQSLTA